jgi:iron(III) transport system substrate-binding protein
LLNKILTEAIAGRHVWDVLSGSGEMHPILLEKNLVGSYLSSERAAYDPDMIDKAGFWSAVYINPYVLGVNTKLVKKEDVPRSYEALLELRWSGGAISLDSDAYPLLTGFAAAWGKEKATAYLERLAAQKPAVKRGNTERVQLAAAGEYPLVVAYAPTIEDMIQKGAPMDWVPLEPVVVQVNPVELAARAVNPNAAKLFIDFMLSKEGQEIIRDDSRVPARKEVEAKPRRLSRGYKRVTVGPEDYKNYDETVKLYQKIFKTR